MTEVMLVHGPSDAAALAVALARVGWGRGRRAIRGGKPRATGHPVVAGHDAAGQLILAAGRGPALATATRVLTSVFALCGPPQSLTVLTAETGEQHIIAATNARPRPAVVYTCSTGVPWALAAAAVHTGLLPSERLPTWRDLQRLPQLDQLCSLPLGYAVNFGEDEHGRCVYALGIGALGEVVRRTYAGTVRQMVGGSPSLLLVDASSGKVPLLQAGRVRQTLNRTVLGKRLLLWEMRRTYASTLAVVAGTHCELNRTHAGRPATGVDHGLAISHTKWNEPRPQAPGVDRT